MSREPSITINGMHLSEGQVITLRVALTAFDPGDLGDDEHGRAMSRLYRARRDEVLRIMFSSADAPAPDPTPEESGPGPDRAEP